MNIIKYIIKKIIINQYTEDHFIKYAKIHGYDRYHITQHFNYENKDDGQKYLIIQKKHTQAGIFEDYISFLLTIDYAVKRGMIPVIDRLNIPAKLQQDKKDWYKKNGWEDYFEQPHKQINVTWVYKNSYRYMVCPTFVTFNIFQIFPDDAMLFFETLAKGDSCSEYWLRLAKEYLRFRPDILEYLENMADLYLGMSNDSILGVSLREEMMALGEVTGNIKVDNITHDIINAMNETGCRKIFVCVEFQDRIKWFQERFGEENVISIERRRPDNIDNEYEKKCIALIKNLQAGNIKEDEYIDIVSECQEKIFGSKYERWRDYIAEMYCLSRCDYAMMQCSSGNMAAILMRNKPYKKIYIMGKQQND